jgi:hypothetical protein
MYPFIPVMRTILLLLGGRGVGWDMLEKSDKGAKSFLFCFLGLEKFGGPGWVDTW